MDELFTVGDLARIIAPRGAHAAHIELMIRRIRHWTLAGALDSVSPAHSGSGRHRRYAREAVYVAAVLNSLSDCDQSIGTLKVVAEPLSHLALGLPLEEDDGTWQRQWNLAIEGGEPVFFYLSATSADRAKRGTRGVAYALGTKVMLVDVANYFPGIVVLNLTKIFGSLTF